MSCTHAFNVVLKPVRSGETWDGLPSCSVDSSGTFTISNLSLARMIWTDSAGTVQLTLTSAAPGQITITSEENWEFDVEPITSWPLAAGNYSWELELTDSGGNIRKRVGGTHKTI